MERLTPMERWLLMCQLFEKLAPPHAAVIWWMFFCGLTAAEISNATGVTPEAVHKRLQRAIAAARELIADNRKKHVL